MKTTIVKRQRGMDGKWFSYPPVTCLSLDEATRNARRFAQTQCQIGGTEIDVRRGRKTVLTLRWRLGAVEEVNWS